VTVLVLAFFLSLAVTLLAKQYGFFVLTSSRPSIKLTFAQTMGGLCLYFFCYLLFLPLLYAVVSFLLKKDIKSVLWLGFWQWSSLVALLVILLLYCRLISCLKELLWGDKKPSLRSFAKDFGLGALAWLISYPSVLLINLIITGLLKQFGFQGLEEQEAITQVKMTMHEPWLFAAMVVGVIAIVPVTEELLFRGLLQTYLRSRLGRGMSIVLTSALFAGVHFSNSQGMRNVELILSLFVLSCYLGFLYERQKTLWAPIGLHMTFNAITTAFLILSS